ncbi:MAG: SCP2 sterol-binding domain-containing protein [Candidatus Hydrogenedentes bacterium]|nr:SCP2 sterol-binding domain-containing protein [Candidatus Hydrogenedentota bacterium]
MPDSFRERQRAASRQYFTGYLPGLRGQLLIPGLRSLSCALGVSLTDVEGAAWTLVVASGRLVAIEAGTEAAQCVFMLESGTLLEIVTGTLPPDRAFFDLRIEIEGDIALGLQLSTVLEPFFAQHAFRLSHS